MEVGPVSPVVGRFAPSPSGRLHLGNLACSLLAWLSAKHQGGKIVLRIGSWGWVGGAKKEYDAAITSLGWNSHESMEWTGVPSAEELAALEAKGRELAKAVKAL